ncbi:MAG: hypothetical protein HQ542_02800 [Bacteroidia bacterium]|nr:hypothetical protein [Bacteroidia bacterium]
MWALHSQYEMTIMHGLRLRGAEIKYVCYDALYVECDVFWNATKVRHEHACQECMFNVTKLVYGMGMSN